jgi:phosphate-selective porin
MSHGARTPVRRAVAVFAVALAVSGAAAAAGFYFKEIRRDGRIYVFSDPASAEAFEKAGEMGTSLTRVGAGPKGETVVADSETALELFFLKHGIVDPVEHEKPSPPSIVWRDGRTCLTLGDDFYMELSSRVQVRFTGEMPDEAVQLPGTGGPGDDRYSFRIARAKTRSTGWFYERWLEYELQMAWQGVAGSDTGVHLEDASINWDVTKGKRRLMVKLGQFKVPFGQQQLTSATSLQFVDRVLPASEYFRGRDQGVQVWGQLGNRLEYRAGLFDGNGINRSFNDNAAFQYDARLRWQPNGAVPLATASGPLNSESDFDSWKLDRPLYAFGVSFEAQNTSNVLPDLASNLESDLWSFDGVFRYRGFSATAELVTGVRRPQEGASFDTSGWFVQGGYFLVRDHWEVAARYAEIDPSDLVELDQASELGGALNYFYRKQNLKVQADFRRIRTNQGEQRRTSYEVRIQTQFVF